MISGPAGVQRQHSLSPSISDSAFRNTPLSRSLLQHQLHSSSDTVGRDSALHPSPRNTKSVDTLKKSHRRMGQPRQPVMMPAIARAMPSGLPSASRFGTNSRIPANNRNDHHHTAIAKTFP